MAKNPNDNANWQSSSADLRDRAALVFEKDLISADVTFRVGPEKILVKGHRQILAMGSEFFTAMLYRWPVPQDGIYDLPTVDAVSFKEALQYLYSDKSLMITSDNVLELLQYAKVLGICRLEQDCRVYIQRFVLPEDAPLMFEKALDYNIENVSEILLGLIAYESGKALRSLSFRYLRHKTMKTILSFGYLTACERNVYAALLEWGKANCGKEKPNRGDLRRVLKDAIYKLRIFEMDVETFAKGPARTLLSRKETCVVLQDFFSKSRKKSKFVTRPRICIKVVPQNSIAIELRNRKRVRCLKSDIDILFRGDLAPRHCDAFICFFNRVGDNNGVIKLDFVSGCLIGVIGSVTKERGFAEYLTITADGEVIEEKSCMVFGEGMVALQVEIDETKESPIKAKYSIVIGMEKSAQLPPGAVIMAVVSRNFEKLQVYARNMESSRNMKGEKELDLFIQA